MHLYIIIKFTGKLHRTESSYTCWYVKHKTVNYNSITHRFARSSKNFPLAGPADKINSTI